MNNRTIETPVKPGEIRSFSVLGARLTWAAFGPMFLLLATVGIVSTGRGWATLIDAIFAGIAILMVLGRWVEMRSGSATLLSGEPASWADFRRYVVRFVPLAVAVWIAANVLGNHVLDIDT